MCHTIFRYSSNSREQVLIKLWKDHGAVGLWFDFSFPAAAVTGDGFVDQISPRQATARTVLVTLVPCLSDQITTLYE